MTAANAGGHGGPARRGRIPPQQAVASPLLERRAAQVASILQTWDAAEMADALKPNVFPGPRSVGLKTMSAETLSLCGKIQSVSELRPETNCAGRFDLIPANRGVVEVFFTMMPEAVPRVQEIKLTPKPRSGL